MNNEVFLAASKNSSDDFALILYKEITKGNYEVIDSCFDVSFAGKNGTFWNFEFEKPWNNTQKDSIKYHITIRKIPMIDILDNKIISIPNPKSVPANWPGFWGSTYSFDDTIKL